MIVPMKRLTLLALKEERGRLIKALQKLNAVHIISSELGFKKEEDPEHANEQELLARFNTAFKLLEVYSKKPGLLTPKPQASPLELEESIKKAQAVVELVDRLNSEREKLNAEIAHNKGLLSQLTPWIDLKTPLEDITSCGSVKYFPGNIREERLAFLKLPELCYIEPYGRGESSVTYLLIAVHDSVRHEALTALRDVDFTEVSFSGLTGLAKTNIDEISSLIAKAEYRIVGIEAELSAIAADSLPTLKKGIDGLNITIERSEAAARLGATDRVFVLEGWIRDYDEELVRSTVSEALSDYYIELRDPAEDEVPPTALKNGKFVEPFESVVNMYSPPAYGSIDATVFMMPFYLLFFGIMLGDTGYGLVLFLGTLLYLKLKRPSGNFKNTVKVIMYCGISTMICGLFIGTFFGMSWVDVPVVGSFLPILFDPMDEILPMMLISCGLGVVQMLFGIGIKMYMCIREGDFKAALCDHFPWMLFIPGLILLLANGFLPDTDLSLIAQILTFSGVGIILLFSNRKTKNPIKRIGSGLWNLYNATSWIGDILSYVRIFALGLVTGAMGMVFNLMGSMIYSGLSGSGVVGIAAGFIAAAAILVATHLFSMFINVLGTYVHCARLQYVEFFGKFYEENGKPFTPLSYPVKNVDIK